MQENNHYPFPLVPLPYSYDALEPYIDARTVQIHHDHHLKTYVDNLNKALEPYPMYHSWSLEMLLCNINALPEEIQVPVHRNGGGVYNHNFYFNIMGGNHSQPKNNLLAAMENSFGSYEKFKQKFKQNALSVFGSGYSWLVMDNHANRPNGLRIMNTANQDTPMPCTVCPLLPIDVWEHAYYLKYQYKRADYIDNWFNVLNWDKIEKIYNQCISNKQ